MIVDVILTVLLIILNLMTVYIILCLKSLNNRVDVLEQIIATQQNNFIHQDPHHLANRLREKFQ